MRKLILLLGVTGSLFFSACKQDDDIYSLKTSDYSGDIAHQWLDLELGLIKQTSPSLGFSPPVASRALGYTGLVLYESVVPGMSDYQSLKNSLHINVAYPQQEYGRSYHWGASANMAMATIIKLLYDNATAANLATVDSLYNLNRAAFLEQAGEEAILTRSEAYGKGVAEAIFLWAKTDGGHQGHLKNTDPNFVIPTGLGYWKPTPPAFAKPVQPHWGKNRPFVSENVLQPCLPNRPITFSTQIGTDFYRDALEVYEVSKKLTQEQKNIALYWADGGGTVTPPGHSMAIAKFVLLKENAGLDITAETYAKVGMAVCDAFISCWKGKYLYNLMRPITYINENIDPAWKPYIATPPFPEYCSGHSTQSGASMQVLTELFGNNYNFVDRTNEGTFAPRSFTSFYQAGFEAAESRLYGGIHYTTANERGFFSGKDIGKNIALLPFKK